MVDIDWALETTLDRMFLELSNSGRWGSSDELGTLNFITPEVRRRAAGLVTDGCVVSIGHDLDAEESEKNPHPIGHNVTIGSGSDEGCVFDELRIAPHGYATTHLDALTRVFRDQDGYNGRTVEGVVSPAGLSFASIWTQREGIVTRGALLDVATSRGVEWLEAGEGITVVDLEEAERRQGIKVDTGDCLLIHTGLAKRERRLRNEDPRQRAGLLPACLRWLHEREIAVYPGDCAECVPTPYSRYLIPLHNIGLASMGLALLDNTAVGPLAVECTLRGRWVFLFMAAPLRLQGGTGSPVNPLCVF
ncbi:MAG: cyclase family protein [Chloroflexota bacterium]